MKCVLPNKKVLKTENSLKNSINRQYHEARLTLKFSIKMQIKLKN